MRSPGEAVPNLSTLQYAAISRRLGTERETGRKRAERQCQGVSEQGTEMGALRERERQGQVEETGCKEHNANPRRGQGHRKETEEAGGEAGSHGSWWGQNHRSLQGVVRCGD